MHLIESYALAAGAKIQKPLLYPVYYPLPVSRYITFQPRSKFDSKNFAYWTDVLELLAPYFAQMGIAIVQIGGQGERQYEGCIQTQGTSLNQAFYIIKNAMLNLATDSFSNHVADSFGVPVVALYGNNYLNCVKPYFGKNNVLLEPNREKLKPSFAAQEFPRQIDQIKPEEIARAVCKLLKIDFNFPFQTVFQGEAYHNLMFETVPDQVVDHTKLNLASIVVRMDFLHNEVNLAEQLARTKCSIVCNKPISIDLLTRLKENVLEIVYEIDESNNPQFIYDLRKLGVRIALISYLTEEQLTPIKFAYMDIGVIHRKEIRKPENIDKLKDLDLNNFYFKSAKITLSENKFYPSKFHWEQRKNIEQFQGVLIKGSNEAGFWKELEHFTILKNI